MKQFIVVQEDDRVRGRGRLHEDFDIVAEFDTMREAENYIDKYSY